MNSLLNYVSEILTNIAYGASTCCMFIFFEPQVPESLREE